MIGSAPGIPREFGTARQNRSSVICDIWQMTDGCDEPGFLAESKGFCANEPGSGTSMFEVSLEFHGAVLMIIMPQTVMLFVSVLPASIWISASLF